MPLVGGLPGSEDLLLSLIHISFLHKEDGLDDFDLKNQSRWKGYPTWLHIIFKKSLCIDVYKRQILRSLLTNLNQSILMRWLGLLLSIIYL